MENGDKNQSNSKIATFKNAKKCLDNAMRLKKDSLKVSMPTKMALIEIAIEELAKGLILYVRAEPSKTPEFADRVMSDRTMDLFYSSENKGMTDAFSKLTKTNVKLTDHQNKLELLQKTLDFIKSYFDQINEIANKEGNSFRDIGSALGKENVKISKDLRNKIPDINAKEMVRIKESGFYVDFRDNKVLTPSEANFKDFDKLNQVFNVFSKFLKLVLE